MCGWVGIFGRHPTEAELAAASATVATRGPDGRGEYVCVDSRLPFGLGHRRLSIQDLSAAGGQPMTDQVSGVTIAYNGEVYNAPEMRENLSCRGHRFRSTSDTEVLLRGYIEWGDEVINVAHGIFSFAIADVPKARVLLARDRFGVKPLYWGVDRGALVAGSAPRALLRLTPNVGGQVDRVALAQFLTLLWIPHPRTPWQGIHKLPPGHALVFEGSTVRVLRYWQPPEPRSAVLKPDELLEALRQATRRQLLSDVPVGALLSGGLDSTLLVHLMAEFYGSGDLHALTAGYESSARQFELTPDDSRFARMVASSDGRISLTEVQVTAEPERILDELSLHFDDPVADPAAITLHQLCKASDDKVLISGVGGEEMWAGYPRHVYLGRARVAARMPLPVRRGSALLSNAFLGGRPGIGYSVRRNAQKLSRSVSDRRPAHYWRLMAQLSFDEVEALMPGAAEEAFDDLDDQTPLLRSCTLDQALAFDRGQFLPNLNLAYVDKASMAAGVEVRVPMLDDLVAHQTLAVNSRDFVKQGVAKAPLRLAAFGLVEPAILNRPKSGFGGPVRSWFRGESAGHMQHQISQLAASGLVREAPARELFRAASTGTRDVSLAAWALVSLQSWQRHHS